MVTENTAQVPRGLQGTYYEDEAPDTLDLVQRAELGLNYFDGITDQKLGYEMHFNVRYGRYSSAVLEPHVTSLGACQSKALEAIAFLRVMTGSRLNLEREARMVDMLASLLGEDGLLWVPGGQPDKPWLRIPEPFAMVHGQGRMARAMMAWYQYTGDPAWKSRIDRLIDGVDRLMVVRRDGYAYFPTGGHYDEEYLRSCYTRRGWKGIDEPANEKAGEEGSLFNHQGHVPGVLATWYGMTGNEQALRLAGELVRFLTRPQYWADWRGGEYPLVVGAEHAHWTGHPHGHLNTLRAILEYAIATNDTRLMEFVRDGYEWCRHGAFPRLGYVYANAQGCGTARLIGLAIKLTDAGVGDYWEDVDRYIRNQGVEMQITPEDEDYLQGIAAGKPAPPDQPGFDTANVIRRSIGGFAGWPSKEVSHLCCGTHGNMGLFYAWEGIVRCEGETARVNLLLNRASPWLDVYSYLPYEGKVVIRNKTAREVFVRVPLWADRSHVSCSANGQELTRTWFGSYLRFGGLQPGDVLAVQFPLVETTERWTLPSPPPLPNAGEIQVHTCRFRGNTLIDISPELLPGSPLYGDRRGRFSADRASIRKVTRFVSSTNIRW